MTVAASGATAEQANRRHPSFTRIPAGSFDYGDSLGEGEEDERPARRREVPAFALGRTAVTAGQYVAFLDDVGLADVSRPDLHGFPVRTTNGLEQGADGITRCAPGAEDYPVVHVSWWGANAYCEWLSERLGARIRLPTEAEWQYAASGPDGLRWALGNVFDRSAYVANAAGPVRVWEGTPSRFGLYNVTGNVFEWCADRYHVPPGAADPIVELPGSRIVKGGAFILRGAASFRNAKRFSCAEASCLNCVGFRVLGEDPELAARA